MNSGTLTLIPTPISEKGELDQQAFRLLNEAALNDRGNSVFVVEDLKPGRQRWLHFKLPREIVDTFVLYNEHTRTEAKELLLKELQHGKNVFLMSDGGLPAFCDPGRELVYACHTYNIRVTSTPFYNSVILALALSGFPHERFIFEGFLPKDGLERQKRLRDILSRSETSILMDTPYRLKRLLEELQIEWSNKIKKEIFLALSLGEEFENLLLGTPSELLLKLTD